VLIMTVGGETWDMISVCYEPSAFNIESVYRRFILCHIHC